MKAASKDYHEAVKVIERIENRHEAMYAQEYLFFLMGWSCEPELHSSLSHEMAQTVRMRLNKFNN
jgi:hypothetical protein